MSGLADAFGTHSPTERKDFINCVIRMWTYQVSTYTFKTGEVEMKINHCIFSNGSMQLTRKRAVLRNSTCKVPLSFRHL